MSNSVANSTALGQQRVSLYASSGERKYVNLEERRRIIEASGGLKADQALFMLTLVWTGARVSEILALRPRSFQIESGVVSLVTLKRRKHHIREVPLPSALLAALDRQFALVAAQAHPEAALCRLWPWHRATAWRLVKKVMGWSGVAGRPASPRGLRHGFGTAALQSGVPLNLVQRWMGHARMETTAIYGEVMGPEERMIAGRFWRT